MTTTYKVKIFSNGVIVYEKIIRADKIHYTDAGIIYLQKDNEDVFASPIQSTIIEKT
jgi:hypothetical protein